MEGSSPRAWAPQRTQLALSPFQRPTVAHSYLVKSRGEADIFGVPSSSVSVHVVAPSAVNSGLGKRGLFTINLYCVSKLQMAFMVVYFWILAKTLGQRHSSHPAGSQS